jgi:hypothetical protein
MYDRESGIFGISFNWFGFIDALKIPQGLTFPWMS